MRLTTKGRYAVTAMLDVAINSGNGPVSLAAISKRQGISLSYLEQLFSKLRKSELVASVRGPGGGYLLACDAEQINIAEVILAVNETLDATKCKGKADCDDGKPCLTHDLWQNLSEQIQSFLSNISLASVLQGQSGSPLENIETVFADEERIECNEVATTA